MRGLGVAIVGCGDIAARYAEDIARQPHLRLVGATDLDAERAAAFAERHATRVYRSMEEALADPAVEIVANLTSHRAHVPVSTEEFNKDEMNKEYELGTQMATDGIPWERVPPGYRP